MVEIDVKRAIKNRVPILKWLPRYKPKDALGDLVAGLTVGMTLIPQVPFKLSHARGQYLNKSHCENPFVTKILLDNRDFRFAIC